MPGDDEPTTRPSPEDLSRVTSLVKFERERLLQSYDTSTARGYRSDLDHLQKYLDNGGLQLGQLDNIVVFRYLRSLQINGYSEATIRRRLASIRSFMAHLRRHGLLETVDIDHVAKRLRETGSTRGARSSATSVLIATDDPFVRDGMESQLRQAGLVDTIVTPIGGFGSEDRNVLPSCEYAIVHLTAMPGLDRFGRASVLPTIISRGLARTTIVVTSMGTGRLVQLRLVEQGCNFVFPYRVIADDPAGFVEALHSGSLDEGRRLPSQWELRQTLGLRWSGAVKPLLEAAASAPASAWAAERTSRASGQEFDRRQIRRLQLIARDDAGLPAPDFQRYASSMRRPPDLPLWPSVRAFVRGLWGWPLNTNGQSAQLSS